MRFYPGSSMVSSMSEFLDNKTKEEDSYSVGINTGGEVADFSEKHFSVANKTHRFFSSFFNYSVWINSRRSFFSSL